MKKICLLFTAVLFLGISSALNAQNLTVSGFVTDASSGEGVPYASVQLKGSTKVYTMTDANGAYSISVPGGRIPHSIMFRLYDSRDTRGRQNSRL